MKYLPISVEVSKQGYAQIEASIILYSGEDDIEHECIVKGDYMPATPSTRTEPAAPAEAQVTGLEYNGKPAPEYLNKALENIPDNELIELFQETLEKLYSLEQMDY